MEIAINNYAAFKKELDTELHKAAEGFVRIGYLLKVARDTNILAESGYKNVTEFAKEEYHLKPDQVTRFIQINERFGKGERLDDRYENMGYTKLVEMLQLPDVVNEELTPEYTREDIRAIRKEITEEKQISDLEVLMEEPEENEKLIVILKQIAEEVETIKKELKQWDGNHEQLKWILAPSGDNIYTVRVRGIGKFMMSIKEKEDSITLINLRTEEREMISWPEMASAAGKVKEMLPEEPQPEPKPEPKPEPQKEEKKETPKKKVTTIKEKRNEKRNEEKMGEGSEGIQREEERRTEKEPESVRKSDEEAGQEKRTEEIAEERREEKQEETLDIKEEEAAVEKNQEDAEKVEIAPAQEHQERLEQNDSSEENSEGNTEDVKLFGTRKEYMDSLTEYGLAEYMEREYREGRLTNEMLKSKDKLEQYFLEDVEKNGYSWREEEE